MEAFRTVKQSVMNNGSILRMTLTSEDVYFIFLETMIVDKGQETQPLKWKKGKKEMLWNGANVDDANHNYDSLKNNPLISGDKPDTDQGDCFGGSC